MSVQKADLILHDLYSTLSSEMKPLNHSIQFHPFWTPNVIMVTFIHCLLHLYLCCIQISIEKIMHPGGKPQIYRASLLTKLTKLGVILCIKAY